MGVEHVDQLPGGEVGHPLAGDHHLELILIYIILLLNARMVECYQGRQQAAGQHSLLQQPLEHGVLLHHEDEAGGGDQVL